MTCHNHLGKSCPRAVQQCLARSTKPAAYELVAGAAADLTGSKARLMAENALLHVWVDRFDKDFQLALPTPVIAIAPLRRDVLGSYRLGRNELGVRTTITLNERWLPRRPFSDTLLTLFHELVHPL